MTTTLQGGEWSAARPGCTLPPGKTRYPFYRRLGGPQGRSGRAENLVPTGIRSRTVQPVVSRYTDWATGPTYTFCRLLKTERYDSPKKPCHMVNIHRCFRGVCRFFLQGWSDPKKFNCDIECGVLHTLEPYLIFAPANLPWTIQKMGIAISSEIPAAAYQTTRCHI